MHKSPGSAANFPGAHWLHWWLCIWKPFSHKHTCLFHIMFGGHDSHGAPGLGRNCVNAHSSSSITCATPKFNSSKTATRHLKKPCIGCVDKFELLFRPRGFVQSSQVSSNIFIALTNTGVRECVYMLLIYLIRLTLNLLTLAQRKHPKIGRFLFLWTRKLMVPC